ncbi:MAG: hypothetical protein ABI281_00790 [Caldimonas sp.]
MRAAAGVLVATSILCTGIGAAVAQETAVPAMPASSSASSSAASSPMLSLVPSLSVPASHGRLSFERVRFAGSAQRVGLVGTSYLIDIAELPGLSVGPAVYGAISGGHGGFFSLGGEVAWRHRLIGPVGTEIGVYAGGGGGGGAPAGSGLMLRPHADLIWDLGAVAVGVSVSQVRFSSGHIDSTQLGLVLNASSDFRFVPAERLGERSLGGGRSGLGFDRIQFVGGVYRTPAGRTLNDGSALPRNISTFGVRAEQAWGTNAFWGLEAARAGRGGVGGYAEFLGTAGVETEAIRDVLTLGGRVAAGMAGGGGVSTGGGLLVKAGLYGIVRLGNDLGLALEGDYARAPNGNFRAVQATAALVWALDGPGRSSTATKPARTDFSAGVERFDAPRSSGIHAGRSHALAAVVLKVDRYLSPNLYVTGRASSAAAGEASGYAGALVGAGWMQPLGSRFHVGAEMLAGAAGGGGVDGRGVLVQPRAYAGVQLTPTIALRVGASRVKALDGRLNSNVVDLGLNFTYGVASGS